MLVVYICVAVYKISTGTPASRGPSATAGLLVPFSRTAIRLRNNDHVVVESSVNICDVMRAVASSLTMTVGRGRRRG